MPTFRPRPFSLISSRLSFTTVRSASLTFSGGHADPFPPPRPLLLFALSVRTAVRPTTDSTGSFDHIMVENRQPPVRTDRKSDKLSRIEEKRGRKKASFTAHRTLLPIDEDVTPRETRYRGHGGTLFGHIIFPGEMSHRCGRSDRKGMVRVPPATELAVAMFEACNGAQTDGVLGQACLRAFYWYLSLF